MCSKGYAKTICINVIFKYLDLIFKYLDLHIQYLNRGVLNL